MSASEKLKGLEQATELAVLPRPFNVIGHYGQWASLAEPYLALRFALPQIVAVVEVAERAIYVYDRTEATGSTLVGSSEVLGPLSLEKLQEIRRDALAALAALDEALS